MAIFRQGIKTTLGTQFVADTSNSTQVTLTSQQNTNLSNTFIPVRVTDVILNDKHPKFPQVGEWNGVGAIFYETIGYNEKSTGFAYPFDPHVKTFPLANEIVLLILIPSKFTDEKGLQEIYYYLNPIGIWNHPHHNANPKLNPEDSFNTLSAQQQNDYDKTDAGYVRRIDDDNSTDIDLNYLYYPNPSQATFLEKINIHPLLPFMGDVIFEGRWGNSLRFGSTAIIPSNLPLNQTPSPKFQNNWSSTGNNGDPITILRNGQNPSSSSEGWEPIPENINNDLSSIYLTSYQKLPLKIANENFVSYTTKPTIPSQFTNPQIALNSNRIVLNANSDSILISGEKSVGMSSNNSVNIESTNEINIASNLVKLGSTDASQSVLRGDETIAYLKTLITEIENLASALKAVQDWPGGIPTPNPVLLNVATCALQTLETIHSEIDSVKSKTVKTV